MNEFIAQLYAGIDYTRARAALLVLSGFVNSYRYLPKQEQEKARDAIEKAFRELVCTSALKGSQIKELARKVKEHEPLLKFADLYDNMDV